MHWNLLDWERPQGSCTQTVERWGICHFYMLWSFLFQMLLLESALSLSLFRLQLLYMCYCRPHFCKPLSTFDHLHSLQIKCNSNNGKRKNAKLAQSYLSGFIFPLSFRYCQYCSSAHLFLWIIQEQLLLVPDIPEIQLCSCKRWHFFFFNLIAYFFHNYLHISSLFSSILFKFFLYYLYLCSICLPDHSNCRIFLSFFCLHCADSLWPPKPAALPEFLKGLIPNWKSSLSLSYLPHSKIILLCAKLLDS